jgi:DNA-binding transcriptional regulator YdaS (Cro superfamily)
MSRMIRKQIYLHAAQEALLKQCAAQLGISEAEMIRRCLDDVERHAARPAVDWQAWEDELVFLHTRVAQRKATPQPRTWTREELYAERT